MKPHKHLAKGGSKKTPCAARIPAEFLKTSCVCDVMMVWPISAFLPPWFIHKLLFSTFISLRHDGSPCSHCSEWQMSLQGAKFTENTSSIWTCAQVTFVVCGDDGLVRKSLIFVFVNIFKNLCLLLLFTSSEWEKGRMEEKLLKKGRSQVC